MGAYDGNGRHETSYMQNTRSQWNSSVDSGTANLVERLSGLGIDDPSSKESLLQVMKAVEAAESTIKQQLEENNHLRTKLQRKDKELERYKSDPSTALQLSADGLANEHETGANKAHLPVSPTENGDRFRWTNNITSDPQGTLVVHNNIVPKNENPASQPYYENQHYDNSKVNGILEVHSGGKLGVDNVGFSQFSSPSSRSFSPSGYPKDRENDPKFSLSGQGLIPVSDMNNPTSLLKQELVLKVREHEEEIVQLRKHLADYSMKEAQICNEKYVLEKRIAYMRLAFDQQQQDLVDAASKALSYRQDIIEENIRLTYALQAAHQERTTFISSLLPLLQDYGFQPPVADAQSIVYNLKVLFKHLQEKLIITEAKLKESQYQVAPWRSDALNNNSSFTPQSPTHSFGVALTTTNKNGLEIVPQQTYSHSQTPSSSPLNAQTTRAVEWDTFGHHNNLPPAGGVLMKDMEHDNLGRFSPASRSPAAQDAPARQTPQGDAGRLNDDHSNRPLSLSRNEVDDTDVSGGPAKRESSSVHWAAGNGTYMTPTQEDPGSSYSPYLPPVLEEPSSSFSEAADEDPLPAIEGLQIAGEAFPGQELQACGYSINGTMSCNFEWVRYMEDGSVHYIVGAKQPNYLVTADDVDSYLAIEVQPLDNRKRKGELVKVFANDQRKITCDSEMQGQIEKTFFAGHASYEVSLSAGCLDIWEPAILAIKKEGYSIKCNGPRGVVVAEKFLPTTSVTIPFGHATEFSIHSSSGVEYLLRTAYSSSLRDTIVLTLRLFIMRAVEKRRGKKKGLFFTK